MAGADRTLSVQDLLHLVGGTHNATADADPALLGVGGKYVAKPTAVAGGDVVVLWLGKEGYLTPALFAHQLLSTATSSAATSTGTVSGLAPFKELDIAITVAAFTGTTPTCDVYFDSKLDGTSWTNIAHLTQITASGTFGLHLTKTRAAAESTITGDAGAGTLRTIGWADDMRVRSVLGGTSPVVSITVFVNAV